MKKQTTFHITISGPSGQGAAQDEYPLGASDFRQPIKQEAPQPKITREERPPAISNKKTLLQSIRFWKK